ncbi:MAG: M1 family metallopeptidase, partial [Gemmatimonadota bacterium]
MRIALLLTGTILLAPATAAAQSTSSTSSSAADRRPIRRTIPMTDAILRAFDAGTRDSTGRPGSGYWQLWRDYSIDARLDPATSTITGRETVTIHNNSPDALTSVALRLDPNIFRPGAIRLSTPSETTDGMVITRLAVNDREIDLSAPSPSFGRRGGAPPATGGAPTASGLDRTNARVNLGTPVPAHGTVTLAIDWHSRVPGGEGRTGHRMNNRWADSLYQAVQWYPRVAVYDDLRGWDTEPYLGPAEFYNDFGSFDVRIDVPAGWLVGATGVLQNPGEVLTPTTRERLSHVLESDDVHTIVGPGETGTPGGGRLVWHFVADTANDFAWGAAQSFVWQATRATIPEKGPVPIHMYYLPGNANGYTNAGPISRHALEFYSKIWMPYSFPVLSLVNGPDNGMEYPMIVMSNQGPADHEIGHEWWPMTVSNNETWYGWMDEGFNQYMNILSAADARGTAPGQRLDGVGQSYGRTSGQDTEAPMMWNANYGGPGYSYQAYGKTPPMLSMLGGIVGDTAVWRAHSEWAKAWRFKHPSPWDYAFF